MLSWCISLMYIAVSAGGMGLSLSYTILLLGNFQWLVRQSAELENQVIEIVRQNLVDKLYRSYVSLYIAKHSLLINDL